MTSLFDGMAGVLRDVFGAPVTVAPQGGVAFATRAIFRELPVEVDAADGRQALTTVLVLQLVRDVSAQMQKGATCVLADGRQFRLLRHVPSGSPAADASVSWELEVI